MQPTLIFITGTDTGVGKTVLTALLTRHLLERGVRVAALKPISAGGREDASVLRDALAGALSLDEINPWHFRAPLSPLLAARRERRRVTLRGVAGQIRGVSRRFDVVLIEGAGGLLSPLGEGFDSRDLLSAVRARPVIVAPNRLGVMNQARLVLEALPAAAARPAQLVLMSPREPDASASRNAAFLRAWCGCRAVHRLPWLGAAPQIPGVARQRAVRQTLAEVIGAWSR